MAQVNDLMFTKLRAAGYTGALADMMREYLDDLGYSNTRALYAGNGFTTGHVSDFAFSYWNGTIETAP